MANISLEQGQTNSQVDRFLTWINPRTHLEQKSNAEKKSLESILTHLGVDQKVISEVANGGSKTIIGSEAVVEFADGFLNEMLGSQMKNYNGGTFVNTKTGERGVFACDAEGLYRELRDIEQGDAVSLDFLDSGIELGEELAPRSAEVKQIGGHAWKYFCESLGRTAAQTLLRYGYKNSKDFFQEVQEELERSKDLADFIQTDYKEPRGQGYAYTLQCIMSKMDAKVLDAVLKGQSDLDILSARTGIFDSPKNLRDADPRQEITRIALAVESITSPHFELETRPYNGASESSLYAAPANSADYPIIVSAQYAAGQIEKQTHDALVLPYVESTKTSARYAEPEQEKTKVAEGSVISVPFLSTETIEHKVASGKILKEKTHEAQSHLVSQYAAEGKEQEVYTAKRDFQNSLQRFVEASYLRDALNSQFGRQFALRFDGLRASLAGKFNEYNNFLDGLNNGHSPDTKLAMQKEFEEFRAELPKPTVYALVWNPKTNSDYKLVIANNKQVGELKVSDNFGYALALKLAS